MARKPINPTTDAAIQRIALYRRVSSPGQVERDLSLPEQASQQRDYVRREGGIITHEFEDAGISAKTVDDRPDFLDMVEAAKRGEFDILVVHNSNRAFRNRYDAITTKAALKNLGITLRSVTEPWFGGEDPEDKLIEGVMECVAEWKLDDLSRETKKGIRSAANNQGRQHGFVPFGYEWINETSWREGWAVCEETAQWVRWMFESIASGMTICDVCRELNTLRVQTQYARLGRKQSAKGWQRQAVAHILRNRVYIGKVQYCDEEFEGAHPAIIDEWLFERVQQVLQKRSAGRAEGSSGLFSGGVLTCPICIAEGRDSILAHTPYTSRRGVYIHRYTCSSAKYRKSNISVGFDDGGCPGFAINEEPVFASIISALEGIAGGRGRIPPAPNVNALRESTMKRSHESSYQMRIDAARRELEDHPRIRERMTWQQGYVSKEDFTASLERLVARGRELEAIIAGIEQERASEATLSAEEAGMVVSFLESEVYSTQQKRDLLRSFFRQVTPSLDKRGVILTMRASSA
jgi:DNA invertase Pin-like site-specific DNA recombinase